MKTGLLRASLTVALFMFSGAASAVEYFVEPGGSDAAAGTNWATAFLTIGNAVAQGDATIVTVSNGTYNTTAEIVVNKTVTLRSFGGGTYGGLGNASNTIVDGPGSARVINCSVAGSTLDGLTITGGGGNSSGAGVYAPNGGTVQNCIIEENVGGGQDRYGGGVYIAGGTVSNCIVRENTSGGRGGPSAIWATDSLIIDCHVHNNTNGVGSAGYRGGGIYATDSQIFNCEIVDNFGRTVYLSGSGCGIHAEGSTVIRNCLIARNIENIGGYGGGGAGVYGGIVENCTIVSNTVTSPSDQGGGVYGSIVTNSIVLYNKAATGDTTVWNYDPSSTLDYSCSLPKPPGVGNIDSVLFVDPGAGNYQLQAGPAVNSGTNLAWMAGALDLAGTNRIISGSVDMGCYERVPSDFECYLVADTTTVLTPSNVVFTASVAGTNTNVTAYAWDFGDGQSDSGATLSVVTNTYSTPGLYTVTLTVTNSSSQTAWATNLDYIAAWGTNAYVCQDCSAPSVPYHTWTNAATAIVDAIAPAPVGVTVVLSNDTYNTPGETFIQKAITLTSFGGGVYGGLANASNTIVDGPGSLRVINLSVAGSVLDGLTISGGGGGISGFGVYMPSGGTVQNCIIEKNLGGGSSYSYGAVAMVGGTISNCIVRENTCGSRGGPSAIMAENNALIIDCQILGNTNSGGYDGGGIHATDSQILNCEILDNVGSTYTTGGGGCGIHAEGSTLIRNCLIARNYENIGGYGRGGGGVYGGRIENCTIVSNTVASPTDQGGGVYGSIVTNSIVLYNTAATGDTTVWNYDPSSTLDYSCSLPKPTGVGNTESAIFVDPGAGNYQLMPSPPVNAGTNLAWMIGAIDLAGTNRILAGRVDMGCYERVPSLTLECSFVADSTTVSAPGDVVFTTTAGGTNTNITVYAWDFGDGQTDSGATLDVVTNTYSTPGLYTVTLLVSNDASESAWATNVNYIAVWGTNAYVCTNSPAPSLPYHTWSNAAQVITDALSPAPAGTTIVLSNGTYNTPGETFIHKAITLTSFGGGVYGGMANASNTIVDGPGSTRVINCTVAGSVLDGLTITGGGGNSSGAGVYAPNGGTVQNCIIEENVGGGQDRYGGGVYIAGGTVSNCIVRENTSGGRGGPSAIWATGSLIIDCHIHNNTNGVGSAGYRGGGIYATDSQIFNCEIVDNVGRTVYLSGSGCGIHAAGPTVIRNCLIARNIENIGGYGGGGAGVYGGIVENCTIVSNTLTSPADQGGGVYVTSGTVINSIIYHNTVAGSPDNLNSTNGVTYSCSIDAGNDVDGNTTMEPKFRDMAAGDYRLSLGYYTPCHDGGFIQGWMSGATDLDGTPRIVGKGVNMGAYEGRSPSLGAVITIR